jgi:predicted HicB family RNase H-like nuclease
MVKRRSTARPVLKSAVLHLRIPAELRAKLEAAAAAQHRTLSNYVEMLLIQACGGGSS